LRLSRTPRLMRRLDKFDQIMLKLRDYKLILTISLKPITMCFILSSKIKEYLKWKSLNLIKKERKTDRKNRKNGRKKKYIP
jgi:hypothetical protein